MFFNEGSKQQELGKFGDFPSLTDIDAAIFTEYVVDNADPGYLTPIIESELNPKCKITRVCDYTEFGGVDDNRIRHYYSTTQPWNCNGTILQTASNNRRLLHGTKYHILPYSYPITMGQKWSNVDPLVSYGSYDNIWYKVTLPSASYGSSTYEEIRTFSDYTTMNFPTSETNMDNFDKYIVLQGLKSGSTNVWLLVYDIELDSIHAELELSHNSSILDFATMSQSGDYVLLSYFTDGTGSFEGMKRYDNDLTNKTHIQDYSAHGDCGYDSDGNECWVSYDYEGTPGYVLNYVRLSDGVLQGFVSTSINISGGHVSCRAIKRPGWAYINPAGSEANADIGPGRVLFAVPLDGSNNMEIWCRTHNNESNYNSECHACPSPDGKQIFFGSNWENTTLESYTYNTGNVVELIS